MNPNDAPTTPSTALSDAPPVAPVPAPAPKKGFLKSIMEMLGFGEKTEVTPSATAPAPETPPMQTIDTSTPTEQPKV